MSLTARLRRCEAQLDWLDTWGPLRLCELQLKEFEQTEQVAARLTANPCDEKVRRMATMLGVVPPPLPTPPFEIAAPPPPSDASPPRDRRFRDSSWNGWTPANVVCVPPSSWPPRKGVVEDWYDDGDP